MKRVLVLLIFLALVACSPPATLVPVDTIVAQTMAAMPRTDTPIPTDAPTEGPPLTETPSPTVDFLVGIPGAECVPKSTEQTRVLVTRVIDGNTIEVVLGTESRIVKYIGIKAPSMAPNIEHLAPQALAANDKLVAGQFVILVKEGSDADAEGALLRHVFVDTVFVNYELVRQGFAVVETTPPDTACEGNFLLAESQAQAAVLGVWAPTPMPSSTVTTTPTITPIPTATPIPICDCLGPSLTCNNFPSQASAQACFQYCRDLGYGDIFNLDKNENRVACEGMP